MISFEQVKSFYMKCLPGAKAKGHNLTSPCPFCARGENDETGKLMIHLNPESYFRGYFRCTRHCVPGGFHFHFARLMGISEANIPGTDRQTEPYTADVLYPPRHMASEIDQFESLMGKDQQMYFDRFSVSPKALKELRVGFNGRYFVYPYLMDNGFAYAGRCVMADREDDHFWHGNEDFSK